MKKKKKLFIAARIIFEGYLLAILVGALLLYLPFSQSGKMEVDFSDALFMAASAVCVSGEACLPIYAVWTGFGQFILLILQEIGGLGIISFTMFFILIMGKRLDLRQYILIAEAYDLESYSHIREFIVKILKMSLIIQLIGAFLYAFVFVPEYGVKGIWHGVFLSSSAFCNSGLDTLGADGLMPYMTNSYFVFVTIFLILAGGLGFPVWAFLAEGYNNFRKKEKRKLRANLTVKMSIYTGVFFLLIGFLAMLLFEWNNVETMQGMSIGQKMLCALFLSVTCRTAGFSVFPWHKLRTTSGILACSLMYIGASPVGTAGGIKTTTFTVFAASVVSALRGRKDTECFHRKIADPVVRRSAAIVMTNLFVIIISTVLFCAVQPEIPLMDSLFAVFTVGLTDLTLQLLNDAGEIILVLTMFFGRVGPITLSMLFNSRKNENLIKYPQENISIG